MCDAAIGGDLECLSRLLDGGCDVNAMTDTGRTDDDGQPVRSTALLRAVASNQQAAARLLLDRGADPSLAASVGITPLMAAASNDSVLLLRLHCEAPVLRIPCNVKNKI